MGSISDFTEKEVLDHILKVAPYTPPIAGQVYLGLSKADPLDSGANLDEHVGDAYVRQPISFGAASGRAITQDALITFPEATGTGWGTQTHWGLFDAESGGNMMAHGALDADKVVNAGTAPTVAIGEAVVTVNAGGTSNYLAPLILDWLFDAGVLAVPTDLYIALSKTSAIDDTTTGTSLIDIAMTGYARIVHNVWNVAIGADPALVDNNGVIDFGTFTALGPETVVGMAITTALTNGEILFYSIDNHHCIECQ